MNNYITKEKQYQRCLDVREKYGNIPLGLMHSQDWYDDPKHLVFVLSRYKFVAKMFSGMKKVLEIGCADAFAARIVNQEVGSLTAIDYDPVFIEDAKSKIHEPYNFECFVHDILETPVLGNFDGAYAIDVLEHIPKEKEEFFISNIIKSIIPYGTVIIGIPSLKSQEYASPINREAHINCKNHKEFNSLLSKFFHNVFIFSMNDEVIHTGYYPMAHYFMALCCYPRLS